MNDDISIELLEKIQKEYEKNIQESQAIKNVLFKINSGATYKEVNEYAIELSSCLKKAFNSVVSDDVLPNERMYYNIAQKLLEPTLKDARDRVIEQAKKVQESLNKSANLGLKPIETPFNQERVNGLADYISKYDKYSDAQSSFENSITNNIIKNVDDMVKDNAQFHYDCGLSPKIIRTTHGKACKWCMNLAGIYDYEDVKDGHNDVFKRHDNCTCTVVYDPKDGSKKKIVHSGNEGKRNYKVYDKYGNYKKVVSLEERKRIALEARQKRIDTWERKRNSKENIERRIKFDKDNSIINKKLTNETNVNKDEKEKSKEFILKQFKNGTWADKINVEKQKRHIESTRLENKSFFFDNVNVDDIYYKYRATGLLRKNRNGDYLNIEEVDINENIGIDIYTGKMANGISIRYSKTGAHIYPIYHEEE